MTTSPRPLEPFGLALVTGASSGIGYALAENLAARGYDLVVVADEPQIERAAHSLGATGRTVTPVQADLTRSADVDRVMEVARHQPHPVEVACLNAGVGVSGPFHATDLGDQLGVIDLNVRSVVHLTRLLLDDMVPRGRGRLLFTSSIAGKAPGPYQATYDASKAFVHLFAEAIRAELKDSGVTVTSLLPGATETEFFDRADMRDTRLGAMEDKDSPEDVARDGLDALFAGKDMVVAGSQRNLVQSVVSALVPDRISSALMSTFTKPRSDD
jgi:short-subunit dehydrogenase